MPKRIWRADKALVTTKPCGLKKTLGQLMETNAGISGHIPPNVRVYVMCKKSTVFIV